jgi:hypothetical protein
MEHRIRQSYLGVIQFAVAIQVKLSEDIVWFESNHAQQH